MSTPSTRYAAPSEDEVLRLVRSYPLAWIVSHTVNDWRATPLPLRPEQVDDSGRIRSFIGHFARSNPHSQLIRSEPRALLLFMGANGYVSPSWMRDRAQAPTWNYASVQYRCELELLEQDAPRDAVLADAVGAMEQGRAHAWHAHEMGPRYATLAKRILAFRARIVEQRAIFKLGQDERDDVFREITAALGNGEQNELREWMERANPSRERS